MINSDKWKMTEVFLEMDGFIDKHNIDFDSSQPVADLTIIAQMVQEINSTELDTYDLSPQTDKYEKNLDVLMKNSGMSGNRREFISMMDEMLEGHPNADKFKEVHKKYESLIEIDKNLDHRGKFDLSTLKSEQATELQVLMHTDELLQDMPDIQKQSDDLEKRRDIKDLTLADGAFHDILQKESPKDFTKILLESEKLAAKEGLKSTLITDLLENSPRKDWDKIQKVGQEIERIEGKKPKAEMNAFEKLKHFVGKVTDVITGARTRNKKKAIAMSKDIALKLKSHLVKATTKTKSLPHKQNQKGHSR